MLTPHQARSLKKLRGRADGGWHRSVVRGIGQRTWDHLVALGFVEDRRDGPMSAFLTSRAAFPHLQEAGDGLRALYNAMGIGRDRSRQ